MIVYGKDCYISKNDRGVHFFNSITAAKDAEGSVSLCQALLPREVGEKVGIAVVDCRILSPDNGIKADGECGFKLGVGKAGKPGIVLRMASAVMRGRQSRSSRCPNMPLQFAGIFVMSQITRL